MTTWGVDATTQTVSELAVAGAGLEIHKRLVDDGGATLAVGQVLQYDTTNNNYIDFTSDVTAEDYVVLAEAPASISGDTWLDCITHGKVRLDKLDSTSKADAEIKTALGKVGIEVLDEGTV